MNHTLETVTDNGAYRYCVHILDENDNETATSWFTTEEEALEYATEPETDPNMLGRNV